MNAPQENRPSTSSTPPTAIDMDAATSSRPQSEVARQRRFRWKIGVGIAIAGLAVQQTLWHWHAGDSSQQIEYSWMVGIGVVGLLTLWWLLFSGLGWRIRWMGLLAAGLCVGLFFSLVRLEGYSGDFIPRFSLRSTPSSEERAQSYWQSQRPTATSAQLSSEPLEINTDDWPQFRGPQRDGIARGVRIRRDWNDRPPRLVWKHPVGLGWSSFAIVDRFAFTQEQRGSEEVAVCYDAQSGEQVWLHADEIRYSSVMGGDGPRATPTVFDSRVYTLGATGILNCFEARTGRLIWSRNIVEDARTTVVEWGLAGSPLVYDNLVVVNPGGEQGRAVAAYDRVTGEIVWTSGSGVAGYAAPRLETIDGVRQVLIFDAKGVSGFDAVTGEQLWPRFVWTNHYGNNCAQPIVTEDGHVFISSGYGTGSALLDVRRQDEGWTAEPIWTAPNRFKLKFNGGVYRDGHVYGLDEGILSCFDLSAGKRKWKGGRYGFGQLLLLDDLLLVAAESGDVALVEISPHEPGREIARFEAIEGKTWNHPVVHGGRLYVRNAQEAACYDVSETSTARSETSAHVEQAQ